MHQLMSAVLHLHFLLLLIGNRLSIAGERLLQ